MEDLVLNIYNFSAFIVRCIIVYYLISTVKHTKFKPLYFLAAHIFLEGIYNIILIIYRVYTLYASLEIVLVLDFIITVIFIKMAFYEERKGPFYPILIFVITSSIIMLALLIPFPENALYIRIITYINVVIIGIWLFLVSLSAYKEIGDIEKIEPWIKARYKLVMIYSIFWVMGSILFFINALLSSNTIVTFALMVVYIVLPITEFLAWIMPRKLKNWLNRNFSYTDESLELSEDEIMNDFRG